MNITLTINAETPRDLQEAIRGLAGSLALGGATEIVDTPEPEKPKAKARTKAADKEPEVKEEETPVIKDTPETTLTTVEIRAKASALSQAGKQPQVKALLKKFEVDKLTELPEERFEEFWEALGELE